MSERRVTHRAKLRLRAERAFGLASVRADSVGDLIGTKAATPTPRTTTTTTANARPTSTAVASSAPVRLATAATPARQQATTLASEPGARPRPPRPAASAASAASAALPLTLLPTLTIQPPFTSVVLSRDEKTVALKELDESQVKGCPKCRLCQTRTHTVFGEGDVDAAIFFIGEGPGENEDLTGRPFVGKAGQLLDKMILGMGLTRETVYIANIVKCRPPENRAPAPDETEACTPYLLRQLEVVRPKVIVTLGHPAVKYMLETKQTMGRLRGQFFEWRGIKLMPTFHPSYVLRSYTPEVRAAVWSDLQQVLVELGLPIPKRG